MHTFAAKQYCVMLLLIVGPDRGGLEPGRSHGNHGNGGVSTVQYSTVQYSTVMVIMVMVVSVWGP